jgi:flagellum-specific peptidoglycan hydrolase FlgJ
MEKAMAAIDYSNADGYQRQQLMGLARQWYKPDTFQEDIRDWHQAYREVTEGKIRTAEDFIYRWNGKLSRDTMKTFLKTFYDDDGRGGSNKTYIGDETAKALDIAMDELNLPENSRARTFFVTAFNNELWAREAQLKRPLSPFDKRTIIQELSKQEVVKDNIRTFTDPDSDQTMVIGGKRIEVPAYLTRMANQAGFTYNHDAEGFFRMGADGVTVEEFDPEMIYAPPAMRPSQSATSDVTLQPAPQRQPKAQQTETTPTARGPKRMPDGREIKARTQSKSAPAAPTASVSQTRQEFLEEIKPGVSEVAKELDIPASVLMAQAILESRWGKSRIGNNLFGVKAFKNWTGATRTATTAEGEATFRDYDSAADSIQDFGRVLNGNRYAAARGTTSYAEAAQAIQDGGYAGNEKDYAAKLINIIEKYRLYEMDDTDEEA